MKLLDEGKFVVLLMIIDMYQRIVMLIQLCESILQVEVGTTEVTLLKEDYG